MPDGDGESIITVVEIQERVATVLLPGGTLEQWSISSLPEGVLEGSRVKLTVAAGDLDMQLLPRKLPVA